MQTSTTDISSQALLRSYLRTVNLDTTARAAGVEATELRRYVAGGINPELEAKIREYLN